MAETDVNDISYYNETIPEEELFQPSERENTPPVKARESLSENIMAPPPKMGSIFQRNNTNKDNKIVETFAGMSLTPSVSTYDDHEAGASKPTKRISLLMQEDSKLPLYMGKGILKQGWLKKKGGAFGIYRKRWCVLYENGILRYYNAEGIDEGHRKGKGDVQFTAILSSGQEGHKFYIENRNKIWHFEAEDHAEAAEWLGEFSKPGKFVRLSTKQAQEVRLTRERKESESIAIWGDN